MIKKIGIKQNAVAMPYFKASAHQKIRASLVKLSIDFAIILSTFSAIVFTSF